MSTPRGVLITNNGKHSAADWAEATASHIVAIAEHVAGQRRSHAVKLQAAVIEVLESYHGLVQQAEQKRLNDVGMDRLGHPIDVAEHLSVDQAVSRIVTAGKGTPWEGDFLTPAFAEHTKSVLTAHFNTSIFVERSWRATLDPTAYASRQFRQTYHSGA
jgi:hypothetical protein